MFEMIYLLAGTKGLIIAKALLKYLNRLYESMNNVYMKANYYLFTYVVLKVNEVNEFRTSLSYVST